MRRTTAPGCVIESPAPEHLRSVDPCKVGDVCKVVQDFGVSGWRHNEGWLTIPNQKTSPLRYSDFYVENEERVPMHSIIERLI